MEERYNFTAWKDASKPMKDWKQDDVEIERLKAEWLGKRKRGSSGRVWQQREQVKTWKLTHKNTIQKMAQKRAYVGAILNATGASEFYTQDVEDMNIWAGAEVIEVKEEKREEKREEKNQTSAPVTSSKPWFNKPQLIELEGKKNFIISFTTAQDLIDEIKKTYQVSGAMKEEITELWEEHIWDTPDEEVEASKVIKKLGDDLPI